jgi:hypothetical protein
VKPAVMQKENLHQVTLHWLAAESVEQLEEPWWNPAHSFVAAGPKRPKDCLLVPPLSEAVQYLKQ